MSFTCSDDKSKWPWLKLHPSNQIPLQMICYFASVETAAARGTLDTTKWSALTKVTWQCHALEPDAAHARTGVIKALGEDGSPDFSMTFEDKDGNPVYQMDGKGVVFQNRDFEAWRAQAKKEAAALPVPEGFVFAKPEAVGVATIAEALVASSREKDGTPFVDALFTTENAFRPKSPGAPGHPYHDGSGDHVNSSHLADAIQQAAFQLRTCEGKPAVCKAGSIVFKRYIELDRTFQIRVDESRSEGDDIAFTLSQGPHMCAAATFSFVP